MDSGSRGLRPAPRFHPHTPTLGPQTLSYGGRCVACLAGPHFGERGQRSRGVWLAQALVSRGRRWLRWGLGGHGQATGGPCSGETRSPGGAGGPSRASGLQAAAGGGLTCRCICFKLQKLRCRETAMLPTPTPTPGPSPGGALRLRCACSAHRTLVRKTLRAVKGTRGWGSSRGAIPLSLLESTSAPCARRSRARQDRGAPRAPRCGIWEEPWPSQPQGPRCSGRPRRRVYCIWGSVLGRLPAGAGPQVAPGGAASLQFYSRSEAEPIFTPRRRGASESSTCPSSAHTVTRLLT